MSLEGRRIVRQGSAGGLVSDATQLIRKAKMTIRLQQLVERLGGELKGDAQIAVQGIAPLDAAGSSHITLDRKSVV